MSTYRGIDQTAADTVELRRALKDLQIRAQAAGLGNRNLGLTVRTGNAPPILTGLSAFAQMRRIFLSWNDSPSGDLARYEIQAATNAVFAGAQTFTTGNPYFTFDNATTGVTYYFRVRAVNISGNPSLFSNTVSITPGGLDSTDVGGSSTSPIVLLQTQTVSSSGVSTVEFTNSAHFDSSAYRYFILVWTDVRPDTASTSQFQLQCYMNGAWATGASDYTEVGFGFDEDTLTFTVFNTANANIPINLGSIADDWDNTERRGGSGWARIYPNYQGDMHIAIIVCHHYQDQDNDILIQEGAGAYVGDDTASFDGVRMKFSGGANIRTGRFSLYGYRNLG